MQILNPKPIKKYDNQIIIGLLLFIIGFVWLMNKETLFPKVWNGDSIYDMCITMIPVVLMGTGYCYITFSVLCDKAVKVLSIVLLIGIIIASIFGVGEKFRFIAFVALVVFIVIFFVDFMVTFLTFLIWITVVLFILAGMEQAKILNDNLMFILYIIGSGTLITFELFGHFLSQKLLCFFIGKGNTAEKYDITLFREQLIFSYLIVFFMINIVYYSYNIELKLLNDCMLTWLAFRTVKWNNISMRLKKENQKQIDENASK